MRGAILHTFAAEDKEAVLPHEFFTKKALGNDYESFVRHISSDTNTSESEIDLEEIWSGEFIEYLDEYIHKEIQKKDVRHGDVFFIPAWGAPGWRSVRVYGIHHVVENDNGVKCLRGGMYTEGMPVGDPLDYRDVSYDNVYKELNILVGFNESYENAWYKWSKGNLL